MQTALKIPMTQKEIEDLWHEASRQGYIRDDNTKRWSDQDIKEAARWLLKRYTHSVVEKTV